MGCYVKVEQDVNFYVEDNNPTSTNPQIISTTISAMNYRCIGINCDSEMFSFPS